jgi:hypothetical protein
MAYQFLSRAGLGAGAILAAALSLSVLAWSAESAADSDAPAKAAAPAKADAPPKPSADQKAREHWETVVLFYGEEDTGEWSLRIDDKNIRERGWFELMEMWHYDREKKTWEKLPTEHVQTAIVMPKDKPSDAPEGTEILVQLRQIRPQTAGIWYAKWRVDGVDGATLMRVGSTTVAPPKGKPPKGTIPMTVPITLEKAEPAFIPDPRINCVVGGAAKSDGDAKPAE